MCPDVLFIGRSTFFGVELQGLLYVFDGRLRTRMLGCAVLADGGIGLAPLDEVLPKSGVL